MWETVKDYLPPTAIAGICAALWRWRPRSLVGFLLAVWNRETLIANANDWMAEAERWMAEAERQKTWGQRWLHQYEECQKEVVRLDAEIAKLRERLAVCGDYGDGGR